ncbi:unnamed protein product [Medioppia subpectinata]|uniref:Uncharacterized protein n=1 Tax=Medioppia subpectinata TaxID=1979941 RepID=A0A7R9PWN7_9ACAR|nr:unnamed protein product [Medioppia subpectinata]CAG2104121.1 unnamed protein product [Medioppia subpectinata]
MATNHKNNENKTTGDESHEVVIDSQPTSGHKIGQKLTEEEELAALGLKPNSSSADPCACLCCVFCVEMCLAPTGGAPPVPAHIRMQRKAVGLHNWDNDSNDGDNSHDGDFDWAVSLSNNIMGDNSGGGGGGHHHDGGDGGHDGGCDGGGGDGGGGGGGGGDGGGGD